jgi:hypothetical protein
VGFAPLLRVPNRPRRRRRPRLVELEWPRIARMAKGQGKAIKRRSFAATAGKRPRTKDDDEEEDDYCNQSTIWTGVRKSTLLKKISAIFPGIRIHPCEAG